MGKLQMMVENFAMSMTAHGVGRIARAMSLKTRFIWTAVWVSMLVMFFIQTSTLLKRFFSYPKSVRLEMANQPVPFPAVSICNLRPLDIHTLIDVVFKDNTTLRWTPGDHTYHGRPNASNFERQIINYGNVYTSYRWYMETLLERGDIDEKWFYEARRELFSRLTLSANLDQYSGKQGGVQATQFIAKCEYAGKKCSHQNFTYFLDPAYLNCFTFDMNQLGWDGQTIYEGPDHGLSLVLFVPTITTMDLSADAYHIIAFTQELSFAGEGVRLVVHEQNTVPYPLTEGLDIPRGVSASIGVQLSQNIRLSPPYGNCTNKNRLEGTLVNYSYTMASCKKTCLQELVAKSCGCIDVALPLAKEIEESFCSHFNNIPENCTTKEKIVQNFDECGEIFDQWFVRNICKRSIRTNISWNLSAWEQCKCYPRCHDVSYISSVSLSDWPTVESSQSMLDEILKVDDFVGNFPPDKARQYFGKLATDANSTFDDYMGQIKEKNWLRVNLYISDTSVVKIEETEAYGVSQLVSDVGGQLGLWIGVSVISIVEVLDLIGRICLYLLERDKSATAAIARPSSTTATAKDLSLAENGHANMNTANSRDQLAFTF